MLALNESFLDRAIRLVAGVLLLSLVAFGPHTPWGLVGLVPLLTGAVGFCPIYRLFGFSTRARPAAAVSFATTRRTP